MDIDGTNVSLILPLYFQSVLAVHKSFILNAKPLMLEGDRRILLKTFKKKKKEHSHAEQLRMFLVDFISEHVVRNKLWGALKTATIGCLTCFSARRYSLLDIKAYTHHTNG